MPSGSTKCWSWKRASSASARCSSALARASGCWPSLRMPLMKFELALVELDSRDAAREVFECVSADGESMEEVASCAGYPYRRSTVFYEDLPADLQPRLVSAMPEEILDPIERERAFELCRLIRKTELDLADD